MSENQINWSSTYAKYGVVAGTILFGMGLTPFTEREYATLYTDFVTQGDTLLFGYTAIQLVLMMTGTLLAAYSVYVEKTSV
jgi:ABC-type transporter lipoprotein component MlaA